MGRKEGAGNVAFSEECFQDPASQRMEVPILDQTP